MCDPGSAKKRPILPRSTVRSPTLYTAPMDKGEFDEWLTKATEHPGSWWPDWLQWLKDQNAETVPARAPGGAGYSPIEDAPGSYVRVKS